ncbi:hypothetical protein AMAG_20110 [Allomyces macrogynus ATCC 38327]|uniref:DUF6589 domain-containing protein n=1 Tax=Allomyces macrogynus (strain ATCC 38327) TaxID=578462 RepID=A0A0L0T776_ALLM3|nr:hypothetical protein AMAG_20110 [Allomyces macrogynus ATCC 38327]|eukprot:KNE70424.1 hypothetical protein AMAG_20110 [Allomyces macrogynus ATCC 38327]
MRNVTGGLAFVPNMSDLLPILEKLKEYRRQFHELQHDGQSGFYQQLAEIDPHDAFLPSERDEDEFEKHLSMYLASMLFKLFPDVFPKDYEPEPFPPKPATKSPAVRALPLWIINSSSGSAEGMIGVLDELFTRLKITPLQDVLIFADQGAAAMLWSAKFQRGMDKDLSHRFRNVFPLASDWHALFNLIQTFYRHMFGKSNCDIPTLKWLKDLLRRPEVAHDGTNFFVCLRALRTLAAALLCSLFKEKIADIRAQSGIDDGARLTHDQITEILELVMDMFTNADISGFIMEQVEVNTGAKKKSSAKAERVCQSQPDPVRAYECEIVKFMFLIEDFSGAVESGNPEQIRRIWKFLLIWYMSHGAQNSASEALFVLLSIMAAPSDLVAAMAWQFRSVKLDSSHSRKESAPDLLVERYVRRAKEIIRVSGGDWTVDYIDHHTSLNEDKDIEAAAAVIEKAKVWSLGVPREGFSTKPYLADKKLAEALLCKSGDQNRLSNAWKSTFLRIIPQDMAADIFLTVHEDEDGRGMVTRAQCLAARRCELFQTAT